MRRLTVRHVLVPGLLAGALALTACGSGDPTASGSEGDTSAGTGSACAAPASAAPSASTPPVPTPNPGSSDPAGVEASGAFGEKPTLTIPAGAPPAELHTTVLSEGDGPAVRSCELLVANYLGQTWAPLKGKPNIFDNSYDRKATAGFEIGAGKVVPGWDKALVGQKVGSRVLLTIPPADGYGDAAQGDAIPAKSTLVFVIDIVKAVDLSTDPASTPVADLPADLPTVAAGAEGAAPTITVPKTAAPTTAKTTVIATGGGDPVGSNTSVVTNAVQVNWTDGKVVGDTYSAGRPLTLTLEQAGSVPGLADALKAAKAGEQILSLLPADLAGGTAGALLIEVVASY